MFIFFCLIFLSLTLYLSLLLSVLVLLIFLKNLKIKNIIFLFSVLTIFTYVFFSADTRCEHAPLDYFKKDTLSKKILEEEKLELEQKDKPHKIYENDTYSDSLRGRSYSPKGKLYNILNIDTESDEGNVLMNIIMDTEKIFLSGFMQIHFIYH